LIGLLILLTGAVVGFSFGFRELAEKSSRMEHLERALMELRAAMNIDSVRQYNIHKVMAIIEHYDPQMPAETKYEIASEIYEMALKYPNLSVDLICAVITHETGATWNVAAKSPAGALGLMQVMPVTGMFVAREEGLPWTSPEEVLFNPISNIRIGARLLSSLIDVYGVDGGLAAYNGGERRAALWVANKQAKDILWPETQAYIPSVLKLYEKFRAQAIS